MSIFKGVKVDEGLFGEDGNQQKSVGVTEDSNRIMITIKVLDRQ